MYFTCTEILKCYIYKQTNLNLVIIILGVSVLYLTILDQI